MSMNEHKTSGSDPVDWVKYVSRPGEQGPGLTKREYFAAMAMIGVESSNIYNEAIYLSSAGEVAKRAVKMADELINELNATP